jgi:Histidine kinase-, DNA gyrase B-, and HSP90-like ATPase
MREQKNSNESVSQMNLLPLRYGERAFEDYLGDKILLDKKVAIIELVANAWDAYATQVDISWPDVKAEQPFSIQDNGSGMTAQEFEKCWMTLSYNRQEEPNGKYATPPPSLKNPPNRTVYGRNGKGRHAGFCFSDESYFVETCKSGKCITYKVTKNRLGNSPFNCEKISEEDTDKTGTRIYTETPVKTTIQPDDIRAEIGMRFSHDPRFNVAVDGTRVTFEDIPSQNTETLEKILLKSGNTIEIAAIDTKNTDRQAKHHGIAWQVQGRLVGEASWKGFDAQKFLDGRTAPAKRFSFIVKASCLAEKVSPDWTDFVSNDEEVEEAIQAVNTKIREFLFKHSAEQRAETLENIKSKNKPFIEKMPLKSAHIWNDFVQKVQEECPSLNEKEVTAVSGILAKLESSQSKYALLDKLDQCTTNDLDNLNSILTDWTVETAKEVLDVLRCRLALIDELLKKTSDNLTDEVHELQPLFEQGLWIFGPEFESIHYTSNEGMTRVIQEHFYSKKNTKKNKKSTKGSLNRPDFTVTQKFVHTDEGSIGSYACPQYDNDGGGEIGVDRLVIIELKKPSVRVSGDQKEQCWKYVKELYEKGLLTNATQTRCFVLGKNIDPQEAEIRAEKNGCVQIIPLTYSTVITRAKSRTHKLYEKVGKAPFLSQFVMPVDNRQPSLLEQRSY